MKGCGVRRGGKYADGLVQRYGAAMGGRQAQIDAALGETAPPAPVRVAAAPAQQPSKSYEQIDAEIAAARAKMNKPKNFMGFAEGAVIPGHDTEGSDDVQVGVTRGEAILPVKTVDAMGGPMAVSDMIHATNGKPPAGVRRGGKYADGAVNIYEGASLSGMADAAKKLIDPLMPAPGSAMRTIDFGETFKPGGWAKPLSIGTVAPKQDYGNEGRSVPAPVGMTPEQANADVMAGGQGTFRGGSIRPDLAGKATPAPVPVVAPARVTPPVPDSGFVGGPSEAVGAKRPTAQTPIPVGTGFITNDQTGATTQVGTPAAATVAPVATTKPAGGSLLDQADEYVNRVAAGQPPEIRAQTRLDFIKAAGGAAQAESATATAGKTRQETTESQRLIDLQNTALDDTQPAAKRAAAQAALKARTGATGYQPIMGKDDMGNPVYLGSFSRETGKAELGGAAQGAPGGAPTFNSIAEAQAAKTAGKIKSGDIINTPNGPIRIH